MFSYILQKSLTKLQSVAWIYLNCPRFSFKYLLNKRQGLLQKFHCLKSVLIWSFSCQCFLVFRLNKERYFVSLHIQSIWGQIRTRKTPNISSHISISSVSMETITDTCARETCARETCTSNVKTQLVSCKNVFCNVLSCFVFILTYSSQLIILFFQLQFVFVFMFLY